MKYLIVYVACMILTTWVGVSDAVRFEIFLFLRKRRDIANIVNRFIFLIQLFSPRRINLKLNCNNRDGLPIIMKLVKFNRNRVTFVFKEHRFA